MPQSSRFARSHRVSLRVVSTISRSAVAGSLLLLLATPLLASGDWASYRGPQGDGVSTATGVFEGKDSLGLDVAWKQDLGSGYSGIAVAGEHLVTLFAAGEHDVVAAFSTRDGRELWRTPLGPTYGGHDGSHDGPISTPAIVDGQVFALGAWGNLKALDLSTGEVVWKTHLAEDHGIAKPHYGFSTSPRVAAGVLVVELGGDDSAVAGFDPKTGEKRWSSGSDGVSYQTPVPWTFEGRELLVAAGDTTLMGVDPASGEVLWQLAHGGQGARGVGSLTPVPAGGARLFLAHQDDGSKMVELVRKDGELTLETLWEGRAIRNSYNVPVYHDGHIYAFSSRILTCVDAATGDARWRSREPGDGFLILVDGHLVIATKSGGLHVAEASPEGYRELAGTEVFDEVAWTVPSFAGGHVFTRSLGELARVELSTGATAGQSASAAGGDSAFRRFVAAVEAAKAGDRKALIDRFLGEQASFPIVESGVAHFLYRGEAQDVGLAGEMYGNRREEPMQRLAGTDLFYRSVPLAAASRVQYLFLVDFEPTLDPLNTDRQVGFSAFGNDLEMAWGSSGQAMSWLAMPGWQAPGHLADAPANQQGRVESHRRTSEALAEGQEIVLEVYVPHGYDPDGTSRHPVAYVHSGPTGVTMGRIPNSLDHLVGQRVEPVIVVFVGIPVQGPGYSPIFLDEVMPFVEANYRIRDEPAARANIGSGFQAAPALVTTLARPDLFAKVGLQSPYIFRSIEQMLTAQLEANSEWQPDALYLDWGTYDLRNPHEGWNMADESRGLDRQLRDRGLEPQGGEAADGTGWGSWRNRTDALFETLFPLGD